MSEPLKSFEEQETIHDDQHISKSNEWKIYPSKECYRCLNDLRWFIIKRDLDFNNKVRGLSHKRKQRFAGQCQETIWENYDYYKINLPESEIPLSFNEWIFELSGAIEGKLFNLKPKPLKINALEKS